MPIPYNRILRESIEGYFLQYSNKSLPEPDIIETELLDMINVLIYSENVLRDKCEKLKVLFTLPSAAIAECMRAFYNICLIDLAESSPREDSQVLGLYVDDGPRAGTYTISENALFAAAKKFSYNISIREFKEVLTHLKSIVPCKAQCKDPDLIWVNNGIYNFKTKQLMPFSPEFVSLRKCRINYVPSALNPIIHNKDDNTCWDAESWMKELSDDPDVVNLLWEITGAVIRPNVSWNKSAWFYSNCGNNGKGTLCTLMRNLCGDGNFASLSIADMGKDFMLEQLLTSTAIISDENDVGTYCDKAANLKAIITGDPILINRKHKAAVPYEFRGFMVQCINDLPKVRDRTESLYRRQIFVPFNKCFTGIERKYLNFPIRVAY